MNKKAIYQATSMMRHVVEFEAAHLTNDNHLSDLIAEIKTIGYSDEHQQTVIDFFEVLGRIIDSEA